MDWVSRSPRDVFFFCEAGSRLRKATAQSGSIAIVEEFVSVRPGPTQMVFVDDDWCRPKRPHSLQVKRDRKECPVNAVDEFNPVAAGSAIFHSAQA